MAERMLTTRENNRDEAGAIAILFAAGAVFLFVLAAIIVDLGMARDVRRDSQNAADASALAAANVIYPTSGACKAGEVSAPCLTDAVNAAKSYAQVNFGVTAGDWAGCDAAPSGYQVYAGSPSCISFDSLTAPSRVWVLMPDRNVKTGLGVLAGVSSIDVPSRARAVLGTSSKSNCGLCLLGTGTHYIQNGNIVVADTGVATNGNLGTQQNNGSITVTNGTVSVQGTATGNIIPSPTTGAGLLVDPLADIELPAASNNWFGAPANPRPKTNPCNQGPGFYNGINLSGNGTCTFAPGLYVITGELRVSGQRSINASGVTLYFTCGTATVPTACSAGQGGGSMAFPGQGTLTISPPTTGPLKGLSIASDRNNTSTLDFRGNGVGSVSGTIYAASGVLGFRGNGAGVMDSLVVVRDVSFSGNPSTMSLIYTEANNVTLPISPPALDK